MSMHDQHEPHAPEAHAAPAPHAPATGAKKAFSLRTMLIGAGVAVLGLLAVIIVVMLVGVYKLGWNNPATNLITHALPLPAATVNGEAIPMSTYLDDVATVHRYFANVKAQAGAQAAGQVPEEPTDEDVRRGVLDRLVQMEILKQEAAHYDIEVTAEEIDAEFAKFQQSGQSADPAQEIQQLYGWTLEQFKDKVMRPYLLQQKLAEALTNDDTLNAEVKKRADDLLAKAKAGEDFATLAKEHSDDPGSAEFGGDLGEFEAGAMVPEFEAAAFGLAPGTISELVKTEFGYHIIKTESVEKDKAGKVIKAKAAHILVAFPSLQSHLEGKMEAATVKKFVNVPEATETGAVVEGE